MRIAQINEKYSLAGGSEKTVRRGVDSLRDDGHDGWRVNAETPGDVRRRR